MISPIFILFLVNIKFKFSEIKKGIEFIPANFIVKMVDRSVYR